ncbi:MAG: energy-coupling factor ABC transporter permease [Oscillospiraceae bacterium]|nr:energy-coupling factor ABC transporter permease [Candidatus Limimonas coprohippi]
MHMADALLSPAVATTMYAASTVAAGASIFKVNKEKESIKIPTMAVTAALVFAGQMINYTIPGTGSSGHICGGMLLTSLLGPQAGFLSMIVILAIQCLFFADGGLLALGANCWNMAFYGCFVGYYLIWKPIMKSKLNERLKLIIAPIVGCILTLQLGAFSVVLETSLSGITDLPFGTFVSIMQPIHLAIGLVEGLVTSAVLLFIKEARPELIKDLRPTEAWNCDAAKDAKSNGKLSFKATIAVLAAVAIVIGGGFSLLASSNPDGLEWSLFGNADSGYSQNMGLDEEDYGVKSTAADKAQSVQDKTSILPDYGFKDSDSFLGTSTSGIVGIGVVAAVIVVVSLIPKLVKKKEKDEQGDK